MKTELSQDSISEITEISDKPGAFHFCAAWLWGSLAGTGALVTGLFMDAGFVGNPGELSAAILFFWFFVALFALAAMVAIGLPLTFLLRFIGEEYATLYAGLGAIAGFFILAVIFDAPTMVDSEEVTVLGAGALAGFASALRWGWWREQVSRVHLCEAKPSDKRDNPIHDLIH